MKTKVIFTIAAMFVLGLAVAVYALNTSGTSASVATASCCCGNSGDSCPMKDKASAVKTDAAHSCCDCCGDAESCPMKKGDAATAGGRTEGHADCCPIKAKGDAAVMTHGVAKADGMASCPMMSKTDAPAKAGITADEKHKMHMAGDASCDCACCHKDKAKKDAPAV